MKDGTIQAPAHELMATRRCQRAIRPKVPVAMAMGARDALTDILAALYTVKPDDDASADYKRGCQDTIENVRTIVTAEIEARRKECEGK